MKLRSTSGVGMSALEYAAWLSVVLFCVFAFVPEARQWVMTNILQLARAQ